MIEFIGGSTSDYTYYFDHGYICDCRIELEGSNREFRAHRAILSNASDFFLNAFTSRMQEDYDRVVRIPQEYGPLFEKVLLFIYSGRLEVDPKELVELFGYASHFGISELTNCLFKHADRHLTKEILGHLIDDCFDQLSSDALEKLVPLMQAKFHEFTPAEFSEKLDVKTFCNVLSGVPLDREARKLYLLEFLGDWKLNDDEKAAVEALLSRE